MKIIKSNPGEITFERLEEMLWSGNNVILVQKDKYGYVRLVRREDSTTIELIDLTLDGNTKVMRQSLEDFVNNQLEQGNEIYCFLDTCDFGKWLVDSDAKI